jgi:hypothetical protein
MTGKDNPLRAAAKIFNRHHKSAIEHLEIRWQAPKSSMKTKLTTEKSTGVNYEPNTFGCNIDCLPDMIRKRAYQICEARGCQPGHEWEDWFQAEREIKSHLGL